MPTPRLSRPATSLKRAGAAALGLVLLAGCADDKPLNTFEPRGDKAQDIYNLMDPIWYIMGVIFVAVIGGTIFLAVKNRVNGDELDPEDLPHQTHGNTRLEVGWTILPGVLLAAISIPVVANIWKLEEKNEPGQLDVLVIGQQWTWSYRYDTDGDGFFIDVNEDGKVDAADEKFPLDMVLDPDDVVTQNELVMPVGEQVDLTITSRDVIHSFWIPRLNGKRDAVPGKFSTWSLQANETGKFTGWCTEFCGLSHARMRMDAIVLTDADFDAWLENQMRPAEIPDEATDPDAFAGRELFINQCVSCHVIREEPGPDAIAYPEGFQANLKAGYAPDLTHFATRSVFAGGIYSQYEGKGTDANDDALDVSDYLKLPELSKNPQGRDDYRWNTAELKRWIANAPAQKDMDAEDLRGMLPFPALTDQQLDQLSAYLATLD